jgi:hypothetical protein
MIILENNLEGELPLYEVEEVSLLDAMLLLKDQDGFNLEPFTARDVELAGERSVSCPASSDIS